VPGATDHVEPRPGSGVHGAAKRPGGDLLSAMRAFQEGDRASFDGLYGQLAPASARRAARMGLDAEQAQEIAQKTLVRVFLYAARARFEHAEQVWAWLYAITTREVYKLWRQRRPEIVSQEAVEIALAGRADPAGTPAAAAAASEMIEHAGDCIGALDEAERMHLLGVLAAGLTFRQAARAHGLSLGQFKHRYERALRKVRDCLRAKGHDVQ
jgi:RNA polymerase sigma-70 factor (ECF subfamily)